jgi:hypothetical protein
MTKYEDGLDIGIRGFKLYRCANLNWYIENDTWIIWIADETDDLEYALSAAKRKAGQ